MKKYSIIILLVTGLLFGCTDLDIAPYSDLAIATYFQDATQVQTAFMYPYAYARGWIIPQGNSYWRAGELAADQLAWPQKGRHGYDGGDWGRFHYHSWSTSTTEPCAWNSWNSLYQGVGQSNNLIEILENIDVDKVKGYSVATRDAQLVELKAVRAWHYYCLMDLYGNIPVVTRLDEANPTQMSRAEAFNWIENELTTAAAQLPNLSNQYAGRLTKAGVYAILASMYLNAEVWTGTARWDDCIRYCNMLINGEAGGLNGNMELDPDIDITYSNTNTTRSKEAIFQLQFSFRSGSWFNRGDLGTYNERDIINSEYGGNNGIVVVPGVIDKYSKKDLRRYSWFMYGIGTGYGPYVGDDPVNGVHRSFMGPYLNLGNRYNTRYCIGTEEFAGKPITYLDKPAKSVISVSGSSSTPMADRRITIEEWYCPEFPGDEAKLLMEEAYNWSPTKETLIRAYDDAGTRDVYNSGAYNGGRSDRDYTWSTMNNYKFVWSDAGENIGPRFIKYKTGPQTHPNYGDNDFVIFRLSEFYFAKAEALMRKNGNVATQEAVDLINAVKQRAFLPEDWNAAEAETNGDRYTTATLTMDELLEERGREFIFEGKRRIDIIRFGKWEYGIPGWWDSTASDYIDGSNGSIVTDPSRRIYPIPGRALQNNPSLVQNPGYN